MRLVRFVVNELNEYSLPQWGRLEGDTVRGLEGPPWEGLNAVGPALPLEHVRLLEPTEPSKVVAIGLNYRDHAAEVNKALPEEPMMFAKPTSAIIGPDETIALPQDVGRIDHEAELAVVIGRPARHVKSFEAEDYILGYTCLNDVSARRYQKLDIQYYRAKGFDTFCPIGPWIETDLDPADLAIRAELNGQIVQDSRTSEMIFKVGELIEVISRTMTLWPGDVIATGTPPGVSPLGPGDVITIEIEGIGRLTNPVAAEPVFD